MHSEGRRFDPCCLHQNANDFEGLDDLNSSHQAKNEDDFCNYYVVNGKALEGARIGRKRLVKKS